MIISVKNKFCQNTAGLKLVDLLGYAFWLNCENDQSKITETF